MPFNARAFATLLRSAARLLRSSQAPRDGGAPASGTGRPGRTASSRPEAQPGARGAGPKRTPSPSPGTKASSPAAASGARRKGPASTPSPTPSRRGYAGDYAGPVRPVYAPQPDGDPDPGEVVWAWVPYEDDPAQGKDRPVLLIGRHGGHLLALMMTSRDRNNSNASDPRYLDVGTGPWDSKGRPSEVKLDRVLQLDPESVRREGAVMGAEVFRRVVQALATVRPAR